MEVEKVLELIQTMHTEEHDAWAEWFIRCDIPRIERVKHFAKLSILEELLRRIDELK